MEVEVVAGRPALVRTGGADLRREAALLAAIAGPGVAEVLALHDTGESVRLATALHPALPRAGLDPRTVAHQLATVLARAHEAGVVHGPLLDEHLLGTPDAVVLAGWEGAGPGDPGDDVAELGRLLDRLAGGDPVVAAAVARASAPDRPTMAALAASLAPDAGREERRTRRPGRGAASGIVAAVLLAVTGLAMSVGRGPTSAATTTSTTARPARLAPPTSSTSVAAPRATGVAAVVHGNEIELGGRRWRVGRPGDVVVVGDLSCSGTPVPALLRPGTGQLWVFDGGVGDGAPVSGRPLATVPGAVDLRVEAGPRCDQLVVVDAAGRTATVG